MEYASGFGLLIDGSTFCSAVYTLYWNYKAEQSISFVSHMLWLIMLRSLFVIIKCILICDIHSRDSLEDVQFVALTMFAMDTLDDLCSFTIIWLVTINYFETA